MRNRAGQREISESFKYAFSLLPLICSSSWTETTSRGKNDNLNSKQQHESKQKKKR